MSTQQAAMTPAPAGATVRVLRGSDLVEVVALDARIGGRSRRGYFVKRLEAALRWPNLHVQVAASDPAGQLAGFVMYRIRTGEFGSPSVTAALEAIGVLPEHRRRGVGQSLIEGARRILRKKNIVLETTQAQWRNHSLLQFLDRAGFELAPRQVLALDLGRSRGVIDADAGPPVRAAEAANEAPREIDYGHAAPLDLDQLARDRVPVRSMNDGDFASILRIDQRSMGQPRLGYIQGKFAEALGESGIRVSLVAELDKTPAGFVMAKIDFGEFGHTEPTAILDTISVDPDLRRRGVARALLSQLAINLAALKVERIETEVSRDNFDLLRFFYDWGFGPSTRLAFARRLT